MPAWKFDHPSPATFSQPLKMSSCAAPPIWIHSNKVAAISIPVDWQEAPCVDRGKLGKGVGWAFGIEASTALIVYGIWQFCRLWM